jgi:lipopolysaccharide transport system permease protein
MFEALWRYRGFLLSTVRRDFQSRYLQSFLGSLWNVVHPAALVAVYTLVFSEVMAARLPGVADRLAYGIYVCAGAFSWGYFAEILLRSQTVFLENANLLKKSSFPRICLPTAVTLTASVNFAIVFALFVAFLALAGRFPGWVVLAALPVLVLQTAFAFGLGILTGTLNVFVRDIGQAVGIFMQFWFWLTPIVYPAEIVPERFRGLLALNPLQPAFIAYQDIFVRHAMPDWPKLVPLAVLAVVLLVAGHLTFRRLSADMIDEL